MYSLNNQYPIDTIPDRIRLSSGMTRTGGNYTDEEIADAGYILVSNPPEVSSLQKVLWDSERSDWKVADKTYEELEHEKQVALAAIRKRRNELLSACDWTQCTDIPGSNALKEQRDLHYKWIQYRKTLRNLPQTYANNPQEVVWPDEPTLLAN